MKSCIQKQVDEYGCNWDLHLQSAVYAMRSSVNNSTKLVPAELILCAKLSLPTELLCSALSGPLFNNLLPMLYVKYKHLRAIVVHVLNALLLMLVLPSISAGTE